MTRRALPGAVLAGVLALGLGVLAAPAASAHDQLVGTDPADGATVETVPDHVTITFEDPAVALGTVVEVAGPDGSLVSSGDAQLVNSDVIQAITAPELPAGKYTVEWRVTSPDGHVVSGESTFTASQGVGGATAPTADATTGSISDDVAAASPTDAASNEAAPDDQAGAPIDSPTGEAAATSSTSSGSGAVVWVVVGLGVLIGIALGLLGWWRGRRRADAGTPDGTTL